MMTTTDTLNRLESHLTRLIDGMLERKADQLDFLTGLNRLDDILRLHEQGQPIADKATRFLADYRRWQETEALTPAQRKRLSEFLGDLFQRLHDTNDPGSQKAADEVKERLRMMGDGAFRLVLKRPQEQAPLAERFRSLISREGEELNALITQHDHLLTVLDDLLKSAEAKTDTIYRHLAASIIYFLQIEGFKVEPYVKRLRRLHSETL